MNLSLWKRRGPINGDLARLREEMERTFDRFFTEPWGMLEPKMFRGEGWLPPVDVSENDAEVTVRAEIPGIAVKDLEIAITGTTLTIAGAKQEYEEKKGEDFCQAERRFGSFRRAIELPEAIDAERITAESENGVVTIHVPRKPGVKPRRVEVKPTSKKVAVTA
jgi:HSP20 family protein